jgi:hypothetical protein
MEAFNKKERQDETQFATKIDGFMSFSPSPPHLECWCFLKSHPDYDQTQGSSAVFSFTDRYLFFQPLVR